MIRLDLIGKKFNKLTVLSYDHLDKNYRTFWKCVCDCGKECIVKGTSLKRGTTKSCGCLKTRIRKSKLFKKDRKKEKDITGQKFGNLIAIKRDPSLPRKMYWLFKCDCGKIRSFYKYDVITGKIKTCGCYLKPKTRLNNTIRNLIDKKFRNLTVIEFFYIKNHKSFFKCRCTCGNEIIVSLSSLKKQKSCGCLRTYKYKSGVIGLNRLYSNYKISAKENNRIFSLTLEEFKEVTSKNCAYCGSSPSSIVTGNSKKIKNIEYSSYRYNGIDRVDSSKGYEKNNIVACCKWCNIIKRERSPEEFKNHVIRMCNHLGLLHE